MNNVIDTLYCQVNIFAHTEPWARSATVQYNIWLLGYNQSKNKDLYSRFIQNVWQPQVCNWTCTFMLGLLPYHHISTIFFLFASKLQSILLLLNWKGCAWIKLRGFFNPNHHGQVGKKFQTNPTQPITGPIQTVPTQPSWIGLDSFVIFLTRH